MAINFRLLTRALICLGCALSAPSLFAQVTSSTRVIRFVVPYAAGGGTDVLARRVAEKVHAKLGQTVIVENRAGADGVIGTQYVAKAPPDGLTFLVAVTAHLVNAYTKKRLPYDVLEDFTGVTRIADSPMVLVTKSDNPWNDPKELALAMRNSNTGSYGSSDSMTRLVGAMYVSRQKLNIPHAAYKGGAPLAADAAGGVISFAVTTLSSAGPLIASGRVKPIGVTSAQRLKSFPNVPTMLEAGMNGFEVYLSYNVYAPAKTPMPILERMQAAIADAVKDPEVVAALAQQGATPVANSVQEFNRQNRFEADFWQKLVRETGIEAE